MTPHLVTTPLSRRIRATLDLFASGLAEDLDRFWRAEDLPRRYPLLLRELFAVSRGASPQMIRVGQEAGRRSDGASRRVAEYLARHVEEEHGHWDWLLDDLQALGYQRESEAARLPSVFASALLGCGYVWALDHHPVCYLGYLSVFEGNPYTVEALEGIIQRSGLPASAFGFFMDHAKLDPHHAADIHGLMDELASDLDPAMADQVVLCALQTQTLTHDLLRAVLAAPLPPPPPRELP